MNKEKIEKAKQIIKNFKNEEEHSNFIFKMCIEWKLSIEEISECYNNYTPDLIKQFLIEVYKVEFKKCKKCCETRSITSFTKQFKDSNITRSYCKVCNNLEKAKYRKIPEVRQKILNMLKNIIKCIILIIENKLNKHIMNIMKQIKILYLKNRKNIMNYIQMMLNKDQKIIIMYLQKKKE